MFSIWVWRLILNPTFYWTFQIKLERDDEGLGTNVASTQNGNARTPLACCTIGRSGPSNWNSPWSEAELMATASGFQNTNTMSNPMPNQGTPTGIILNS